MSPSHYISTHSHHTQRERGGGEEWDGGRGEGVREGGRGRETLMVLSSEAVRREWPSLAKWTLLIDAVCALSTVDSPLLHREIGTQTVLLLEP